jgi:hypothetical protein
MVLPELLCLTQVRKENMGLMTIERTTKEVMIKERLFDSCVGSRNKPRFSAAWLE